MVAHRVEATIQQDGKLSLENLPFHAGEVVEIIILTAPARVQPQQRYPLRGTAVHYERPFDPVGQDVQMALAKDSVGGYRQTGERR